MIESFRVWGLLTGFLWEGIFLKDDKVLVLY